jgi:hypothetical protein
VSEESGSAIDEPVYLIDDSSEPWSIRLEVGVEGRDDADRLRAAPGAASTAYPVVRARKAPTRTRQKRLEWESPTVPMWTPLSVSTVPDPAA